MSCATDEGFLNGSRLSGWFFIHVWRITLWTLREDFICYSKFTKQIVILSFTWMFFPEARFLNLNLHCMWQHWILKVKSLIFSCYAIYAVFVVSPDHGAGAPALLWSARPHEQACLHLLSLRKTSDCFTGLCVLPVSAAYSQACLQGLKLGPFVQTNVMTRKLFLAQKSSLGGLIFALLSPVGEWTRARAHAPPLLSAPPSQATRCWSVQAWHDAGWGPTPRAGRRGRVWTADGMRTRMSQTHLTKGCCGISRVSQDQDRPSCCKQPHNDKSSVTANTCVR